MTDNVNAEAILADEIGALYAASPWQLALISQAGAILAVSRPLLDLLNTPATAWLGKPFDALVIERERPQIRALLTQVGHGETIVSARAHLAQQGRFPLAVEFELLPIDTDAERRLILVVYPISILHRREQIILEFNRLAPRMLETRSAAELYTTVAQALQPLGMEIMVTALEPDQMMQRIDYLGVSSILSQMLQRLTNTDFSQLRIPRTVPFFDQVFERREALFIEGFVPLLHALLPERIAGNDRAILPWFGVRKYVLAPLLAGAQVRGALMIWSHVLDREQVPFIEAFAYQLGTALAQIELRAQMERQMQRLNSLATIAHAVTTLGSLDDVLRVVCTQAQELLGAEFARIAAPVEDTDFLIYIMSTGAGDRHLLNIEIPIASSISGTVFRTGQGRVLADLQQADEVYPPFRTWSPARSVLYQPLKHQGAVLGVLIVGHAEVGYFKAVDLDFAGRYAEYAAVAIANAQLHAALQRSEREAKAMHTYLNTLMRNTPALLLTVQPDMTVHVLNPDGLADSSFSLARLEGRTIFELTPPQAHAELVARNRLVQSGIPQSFELDLTSRYGKPLHVLLSAALNPDYGELFVIIKDVTEQRQREAYLRQNEKLAALGGMVAGAAHELNNPLAAILGLAQLQIDEPMADDLRADLRKIERAALRARSIVQRLLHFASPQPPQLQRVALWPLIRDTIERLEQLLDANDIEISCEVATDLPPTSGDPHQLEQLFFNILHNAAQWLADTPADKSRRLRIAATVEQEYIQLTIEDSGPGISPEYLSRIFEPFFTTRAIGQGTGLGLAICHAIVQQHKGRIWAQSRPGQGSTFFIELPLGRPVEVLTTN